MSVPLISNEQMVQTINNWYKEIRERNIEKAESIKTNLEEQILQLNQSVNSKENPSIEESETLLYFHLINFRFNLLQDNLSINNNSFNEIDSFEIPAASKLTFYYNFFKALHSTSISNYKEAREYFDKANQLIHFITDDIEKSEYNYNLATFYYHNYQAVLAITYGTKAKDEFSKHSGYEMNIAACNNLLGLACSYLREYELAEEYFTSAIDTFKKNGAHKLILKVRHNIGLMYAEQDLSELAVRYLEEVNQNIDGHYKALFIEARERFKLGQLEEASRLSSMAYNICKEKGNKEYIYRIEILMARIEKAPIEKLETVILEGNKHFEIENLYEYVQFYFEYLALQFREAGNSAKASEYFYLSYEAKKKIEEKERLK
ncbi:tetratricopeptide repeat protein [Bacillus cereus]|uniref:response regulator aspartate phosphatase n=1 Tax=Bacillus cereus TaxID=1396 RepID=UPI000B4A5AD9|nr:tetratricopeptide repeat protein [Bacillus cereus]